MFMRQKRLFFLGFLLMTTTACVRTIVTGGKITNSLTGLHRDTRQLDVDLALEKVLRRSIEANRRDFLYMNNLDDFGYYQMRVMESRVLLTGVVFNDKIREYLLHKINENVKVREVLDEVQLAARKGLISQKLKDFFLEKQIYTRMFFKSKVKSLNYEISVVDGIVYVIGIAADQQEHELLTQLLSTVSGVKEVISHVITIDSIKKIKIEYL
jgi:osmotically-inducible protein OsmY